MASSNIAEIDALLDTTSGSSITGSSSLAARGAIHDLLRGHGYKMPSVIESIYGTWGPQTKRAIADFRVKHLPGTTGNDSVEKELLQALVAVPATNPLCTPVYVTRSLDIAFSNDVKIACYVALGEARGSFSGLCFNTDNAGLSAGMIQWSQRTGRLHGLLRTIADDAALKALMVAAFGSAARVDALLAHTSKRIDASKVIGGVKPDGKPLPEDSTFDLTLGQWPSQFRTLFAHTAIQKAQVKLAAKELAALRADFDKVSTVPRGERLIAYLADVGNQFGGSAIALFQTAINKPGLPVVPPATQAARDAFLIDEVTVAAKARLTAIGKKIVDGKQNWSDAFIKSAVDGRESRKVIFRDMKDLSDSVPT
jgi:hypothetical protein